MSDPRQSSYLNAVNKIKEDMENVRSHEEETVMYASAVNLGRLQDNLKNLMEKKEITSEEDIIEFIRDSVQRVKSYEIKPQEPFIPGIYYVKFTTKDDYGFYDYAFYTRKVN